MTHRRRYPTETTPQTQYPPPTIHQHNAQRSDPIATQVTVPLLHALLCAIVAGLTATAITMVAQRRTNVAQAAITGTIVGLIVLTVLLFLFTWQHRLGYLRSTWPTNAQPPTQWAPTEPHPPLVLHGRRPQRRPLLDILQPRPAPIDPELIELYTFITRVWPTGNVSRDHCIGLGISRATWDKLVGGRRTTKKGESTRGLLDRLGLVEKRSTGWEICANLQDALSINDQLLEYANSRATVTGTGQAGQARPGHTRNRTSLLARRGQGGGK